MVVCSFLLLFFVMFVRVAVLLSFRVCVDEHVYWASGVGHFCDVEVWRSYFFVAFGFS